jgi:hypothetical protein
MDGKTCARARGGRALGLDERQDIVARDEEEMAGLVYTRHSWHCG